LLRRRPAPPLAMLIQTRHFGNAFARGETSGAGRFRLNRV
jgi:hypothetical protein